MLKENSVKLNSACRRFLSTIKSDQRTRLMENDNDFEAILNLVEVSTFNWGNRSLQRTVSGKCRRALYQSCKSLDERSVMLDLLPSSSEYVSVFCGSLKVLIQVRTRKHWRKTSI